MKKTPTTKEIHIKVQMDEQHIPEKILWSATDAPYVNAEAKAFIVGLWDADKQQALRLDMWTKEMPVGDMQYFIYQMFMTMADTYRNATNDENTARNIRNFAQTYAQNVQLQNEKK